MRHTRRKFLATTLTVLATSGLSCGGDEAATPPTGPDCLSNGATVDVVGAGGAAGGAHRHALSVSQEDVRAGVEKTYEVSSPSTHPHSLTLTADHFASLQANQSVTVPVTTWTAADGRSHTHTAAVSCS